MRLFIRTVSSLPANPAYLLLVLASVAVSLSVWTRLARRDSRLLSVYIGGLVVAFAGAKLVYMAAEGWMFRDYPARWQLWAAGKSILGALLGGYLGVEFAKKLVGYESTTGDLFALVVPMGIVGGRIGCLLQGCCPGIPVGADFPVAVVDSLGIRRWPAVPAEIVFQALFLAIVLGLRSRRLLPGQHFHLYLIAYGGFRFVHEFLRATPRIVGPLSGYHLAALGVMALGIWGFAKRRGVRRNAAS